MRSARADGWRAVLPDTGAAAAPALRVVAVPACAGGAPAASHLRQWLSSCSLKGSLTAAEGLALLGELWRGLAAPGPLLKQCDGQAAEEYLHGVVNAATQGCESQPVPDIAACLRKGEATSCFP